jgi:hypothetical protein
VLKLRPSEVKSETRIYSVTESIPKLWIEEWVDQHRMDVRTVKRKEDSL